MTYRLEYDDATYDEVLQACLDALEEDEELCETAGPNGEAYVLIPLWWCYVHGYDCFYTSDPGFPLAQQVAASVDGFVASRDGQVLVDLPEED